MLKHTPKTATRRRASGVTKKSTKASGKPQARPKAAPRSDRKLEQASATDFRQKARFVLGLPNYSPDATPGTILAQAARIEEAEAIKYLECNLIYRGWAEDGLKRIREIDFPLSWILHYQQLSMALSEFTFLQWQRLVVGLERAIEYPVGNHGEWALKEIAQMESGWSNPVDQMRVRFWALGQLWFCMEPSPQITSTLHKWFGELNSQHGAVRDQIRRLWHDHNEQPMYDQLPEEIEIFRGGIFPSMLLGVSYTFDASIAAMASRWWGGKYDRDFNVPGNSGVLSLKVPKDSIIGLKKGSPYYGDGCVDVVMGSSLTGTTMPGI